MPKKKIFIFTAVSLIIIGGFFLFSPCVQAAYGDTTTFIGKLYDGDNGQATSAFLDFPEDIAFDTAGNLYIADTYNNVIRKVDPNGIISTYAGTGSYGSTNGAALSSEFALPKGIAVDSSNNVYVADTSNNLIRKIDIYGSVSTLVSSGLAAPEGLILFGNYLYIADTNNNAIKRADTTTGDIITISTSISSPGKMAISADGAYLYVSDNGNYRVVKINTSDNSVSVIAGSGSSGYQEGVGTAAQFRMVWGIGLDAQNNCLYVTDEDSSRIGMIRKIDLATLQTTQFVYDSSMATVYPRSGVKIYGNYIYLSGNGTIYRYNKNNADDNGIYAGSDRFGYRDGSASSALIGRPYDMVISPDRQYIYLAENNKIRRINRTTGEVSFVIGNSVDSYDFEQNTGAKARFSNISGITINSAGDTLYVVDRWNNRIRGINIAAQSSFLVSGSGDYNVTGSGNGYLEGTKDNARFNIPADLVISPDDQYLYVTDTGNEKIRKVRISDGQTWLVAGSEEGYADGIGASAKFNDPYGLDIDTAGQYLYVADLNNHRIRKIKISTGEVTTIVGSGKNGYLDGVGTRAVLSYPIYVEYNSNKIFFTEAGSHRVRLVELSSSVTKLVAGSGERGFKNGTRTSTKFNNAKGLVIDSPTNILYVADSWNDMIRKIDVSGEAPYSDPAPVISEVKPNKLKSTTNQEYQAYLDVLGTGFKYGIKTVFGDNNTTTYQKSSTALTVVIPLGKMKQGWYDVKVTNLDGQYNILSYAFAVSDSAGNVPNVHYSLETLEGFLAYSSTFSGEVNLASGDLNGDGLAEVITGAGAGAGPQVRIFNSEGTVISQFMAYASSFRGGVKVASADVDGDGLDEIVTAPGPGGGPHIRVFNMQGQLESQFFAYATSFRRGVNVAVGDLDGDGIAEIVTGTGPLSAPHVRVFDGQGHLKKQFFAYPSSFRIGINVAVGDVNNDGFGEIITAPVNNGGPHIRVFNKDLKLISQFFAYGTTYRGGVNLAIGDVEADGTKEIITGTSEGKAPHLRVFNYLGQVKHQFYAFTSNTRPGVNVASQDVNGDGVDEIIVARVKGIPEVIIYDKNGDKI